MERAAALLTLESLSSGIRLDIFRLLVRQGPEGLVAGEMATALELAPSNLSFHLKALTQSNEKGGKEHSSKNLSETGLETAARLHPTYKVRRTLRYMDSVMVHILNMWGRLRGIQRRK